MKRVIAVLFALFFVFGCFGMTVAEENNLLKNGSFEKYNNTGIPDEWYVSAYRTQEGYSRLSVTNEKAYTGRYSALVENASSNDARFTCTVEVEPEALYRLSGYVLVERMEDTGNGANFGIEGIYSFSDCLYDTNNEWRYLEWYGETGQNQSEVTIGIRVGGYSAESTGKAYFDDIKLEKVNELPRGVIASLWYNENVGQISASQETKEKTPNTFLFIALAVLFLMASAAVVYSASDKKNLKTSVFAITMFLALVLRVILAVNVEGYAVDINCFKAWSLRMAQVGPAGFYAPDYFCDYPPGAMLLLWPVGLLLNAVGLQNVALSLFVVKTLPILGDLAGAYCVYRYTRKRLSSYWAIVLACLYLFNPAVLVNGAAWGQMDSVLALFVLLTTFAALDKKWSVAIPLFAVSALVKPQALLFAPVGGVALLSQLTAKKDTRQRTLKQAGLGCLIAIACAACIIFPFSVSQDKPLNWLFALYGETLGSYAYATLNTANLYYLIGANWLPLSQFPSVVLMWSLAGVFAMLACGLALKKTAYVLCKHTCKRQLLAVLNGITAICLLVFAALKVNYGTLGYAMMAYAYLWALICLVVERDLKKLPFWMAVALIGVYVIGVKVHERYLFPALVLMLIGYVTTQDRRILGVFAGFSVTTFINTAIVLRNSIQFGAAQGHLNSDTMGLNVVLCIANLLLLGYAYWISLNGLRTSTVAQKKKNEARAGSSSNSLYENLLLNSNDHKLHLNLKDTLLVCVITIAYAALAFSNLGSPVAPQTAWVSTAEDESIVVELEDESVFSVLYYAGVSYRDFSIAVSDDGVNWSEEYPCEMREGLCYRWNYALNTTNTNGTVSYPSSNPSNVLWLKGKYLRINACSAGLNLWEIVARGKNGENIPVKLVEHTNSQPQLLSVPKPAEHLIDEQATCIGEPGWYTGTYFDEIYHARTAYEHLHGQAPYETTHPPLGKLMMSVCIAIFGMTPFGWRFAGALIGVLMLPAMYLLVMQLTHKRKIAAVSMAALALDLMHFTQTRIATIDSFPVFFIMLTYLFMIRYMQMDFLSCDDLCHPKLIDKSYLKTQIPLLLCGVCMGLSIACKWIGIYSAVGLAILFFYQVYRQFKVWNLAWKAEYTNNTRAEVARNFTLHRIAITCGFCILFFVIIPCAIYAASYIPYLKPTGPITLKRIIAAQQGMLSYHSTPGLGMDHPFQSQWWQWPFILKPMWFAQDSFEPAGYASTIMCLGNPWIFYIGAVAMVSVLVLWFRNCIAVTSKNLHMACENDSLIVVSLAIGFLAQYLPWVLVPRSMYMYHYFASVPFIIIATAVMLDWLLGKKERMYKTATSLYLVGALVFFVMFFPYASGYTTDIRWLDAMKWFSKLYY